jgi:GT2 family glycosyltransferase
MNEVTPPAMLVPPPGQSHSALPELACGLPPPAAAYDADIIILTLNRFTDTVAAARSALAQTGVSIHVSVLDQGSAPHVRAAYVGAFKGLAQLAYYTVAANLGVGGGRNHLAAMGRGRVIISLDNDALFEDATVAARAVRAFDQTLGLGAVGFKILAADGVRLDDTSWGYPARLKSRREERFDTTTFVGAGYAVRREAWRQAGGYDAQLFFTWEEYDFCLRAISLGWLIRYDGSLAVIHKVAPEARVGWGGARTRFFVRNRVMIARKWGASWVSLLPRLAGYLLRGLWSRRLSAVVAGIGDALRRDGTHRPRLMSPAMREYVFRNETVHRGSLPERLRVEVFGRRHEGV